MDSIHIALPHRRRNPLTGDWVLVSPHRLSRPWQGQVEPHEVEHAGMSHDPQCYLCPGNERANGQVNPTYKGVYVFENDFPALLKPTPGEPATISSDALFQAQVEHGECRVVCFSPDHSRTLSDLSAAEIRLVIDEWAKQTSDLGQIYRNGSVQVFENKGAMMGCSNPHPHAQIWAQASLPTILATELEHCQTYFQNYGTPLLTAYAQQELEEKTRIVSCNDHFIAVVPYWATWPFEILICPLEHHSRLPQLCSSTQLSFAEILGDVSRRYDALFGISFPYSAGIHQAPQNQQWDASFSLHMHFYPPLLRSATVRKFMVGYEMLAESQRDLTPEAAAKVLRDRT